MKNTSMKQLCSFFAIAVFATAGVANGNTNLGITDSVTVQADGTFPADGAAAPNNHSVSGTTLGAAGSLAVRERDIPTQTGLRVASLIQLDLGSLNLDVNDPTFNVIFSADVVGILNSVNNGIDVNIGRNQSGPWSSTTGSEPSFFAGLGNNGTIPGASDVSTLISDVSSLATGLDADSNGIDDGFDSPNIISADITAIVVDWVNNGGNDGLVLFAVDRDGGPVQNAGPANNGSQAVYLDSISVLATVAAVPEPSSLMVLGLGMAPVLLRRRR